MDNSINQHNKDNGNNTDNTNKDVRNDLGKCPRCGGRIIWGKYGAFCGSKCGMSIAKIYGRRLLEDEVQKLLTDGKVFLIDMINKEGKKYSAYFIATTIEEYSYTNEDGQVVKGRYRYKFKLEYPRDKEKIKENEDYFGARLGLKKKYYSPKPRKLTDDDLKTIAELKIEEMGRRRRLMENNKKPGNEDNDPNHDQNENIRNDKNVDSDLKKEQAEVETSMIHRIKEILLCLFGGRKRKCEK